MRTSTKLLFAAMLLFVVSVANAKIDLQERIAEFKYKTTLQAPWSVDETAQVLQENILLCEAGGSGWAFSVERWTQIRGKKVFVYYQAPFEVIELDATDTGTKITIHSRYENAHGRRVEHIKRWVVENFTCE